MLLVFIIEISVLLSKKDSTVITIFRKKINNDFNLVEVANKFMDINCCWLSIIRNDDIDYDSDIIEVEIITNTYKLKK